MDDIAIPAVADIFRHMRSEPGWRLERILDQRAALFQLLSPPPEEDWRDQRSDSKYPDFAFAALPERVRLHAGFSLAEARSRLTERYPALRAISRRLR